MRQLSIYDVARLAVAYWVYDDAIKMVAICGAESGYIEDRPSDTDVWGMPGEQSWWRPYSCDRVYSWGLWQIFMPVHKEKLGSLTNSSDPCFWSAYLCDPVNNARVARWVWTQQGFNAWSTYQLDRHLPFLAQATAAVDAVSPLPPPGPGPLPPPVAPPSQAVTPPTTPVAPPPSL